MTENGTFFGQKKSYLVVENLFCPFDFLEKKKVLEAVNFWPQISSNL
jgi:hypothetical protein